MAGLSLILRFSFALIWLCISTQFVNAAGQPLQLKGHGGPIKAISISADGSRALTASFDYSIILWDLTTQNGQVLHRMYGHDAAVNDVVFLGDETRAVSVSDDGSLAIWDLQSGKMQNRIVSTQHKVLDVAISKDDNLAAVARWDGTVRVYDLATQSEKYVLQGHRGNVNAVVFSQDNTKLYSAAYDGQILEWDIEKGEMIRPIYRHGWGINSITVLDDNNILYGSLDGTVAIVDIEKAEKVKDIIKRERPIQSVKTSPNKTFVAYGDGAGWIGVYSISSGEEIEASEVTFGPVWDFDFVADTNQIYHVGLDDFAARWQISPRKYSQNQAELPRRFQVRDSKDLGELEFQRKCSVCHTLTPDGANRAGPTLYDVFGRKAGTLPGYPFSEALLNTDIVWTAQTIGQLFIDGPDVMLPGTKMPIQRLKKVERREDLIRYLETATKPQ